QPATCWAIGDSQTRSCGETMLESRLGGKDRWRQRALSMQCFARRQPRGMNGGRVGNGRVDGMGGGTSRVVGDVDDWEPWVQLRWQPCTSTVAVAQQPDLRRRRGSCRTVEQLA